MKFKLGLMIGFGVGYVLGAKAGRERYEEIRRMANRVAADERVQKATERGKEAVEQATDTARERVGEGFHAASEKIRDLTDRETA